MKKKVGKRDASHKAMVSIADQMKDLTLKNKDENNEVAMPMVREKKRKEG